MTRVIYETLKHGVPVQRIDNVGAEYILHTDERNWLNNYPRESLLHKSEEIILWNMAKNAKGDIANLGHALGGSATVMAAALKFANKPYILHSVDTFKGPASDMFEYRQEVMVKLGLDNAILYKGFTDEIGKQFVQEGRQFDFTFIDAGHDYENVKQDWAIYSPMSRTVAFHDTNQIPSDDVINEDVLTGPWKLIYHVMTIKVFERT